MTKPRAIIYGLGAVGRKAAEYLDEKGVEVVAAYVRNPAGRDFSHRSLARARICAPDVPLAEHGADLALLTHCSSLPELRGPALACAKAGLHALTIAEDAYEPFFDDADTAIAHELDHAFRAAGRTLVSVGVQDTLWFGQPLALSAAAQRIDRIVGENICDLGAFARRVAYAGLTPQEFHDHGFHRRKDGRGVFEVALRPLLRALDLEIRSIESSFEPLVATEDLWVPSLDLTIGSGRVRGALERVIFHLAGGVTAEGRFIRAYLPPGVKPYNAWTIEGKPSLTVRCDDFSGAAVAPASLVNRIPDVLAAPPGFLSVDRLPAARLHRRITMPA